ncbi:MAG: ribosome maturation factor RimM [Nitrosomonas sp.]|nr:ribosome maturation factor RimM [Nitrosomonas sp.]MCW5607807.1 ribosome maturation factor RimM [Nitrosomonas sp.]
MVIMGHVTDAFGIRGWIRVYPYTGQVDNLLNYKSWWLGKENKNWYPIQIITGRQNGNFLDAKPENCNDRNQALLFKGMQIAIPRANLPRLPDNGDEGYYWSDLVGSEVINLNNEKLGMVVGLFKTGASDVLRIQDDIDREKELLIPFIEQKFIIKVELDYNRIIVDWEKDY